MTEELLNQIYENVDQEEGRVPWLYRDNAVEGNATCAAGHLVASYAVAQAIPFDPPIEPEEWEALMDAPVGMKASFYQKYTLGRLTDPQIDALRDADVAESNEELRRQFPQFDSWPDGVQAALVDMEFNLGLEGLLKFHKLMAALEAEDWTVCSLECHRRGISEERNKWTATLFLGPMNS
jgi:hypothetical protein